MRRWERGRRGGEPGAARCGDHGSADEADEWYRSDSLAACRAGPPALALTTFDDDELLSGALRAGAAGFILKDSPAEELVRAVHAVARGEAYLDPAVTSRVLNAYRRAPAAVSGMPRTNSPHGNWMCWHSSPPGQPTPKSLNNS